MIRIFERTSITHHQFGTIAVDGTGGGPVPVTDSSNQNVNAGILRGITVACDSTNFSISLRSKFNALANSVDEIYTTTSGNKRIDQHNLFVGWRNRDIPQSRNLYLVIVNSDANDETNTIQVRMTNSIHKRFSKN